MKKMWIKTVTCGFFCVLMMAITFGKSTMICQAEELKLYATSAVLLDAQTGRVLYGKNETQVMPMASTTKVMTAIIVLEELGEDLGQEVGISAYASGMPKVKLYVKKGEKYSLRDLLYSLMLESHNDSAVALAEHVGKRYVPELANRDVSDFSTEESKKAVAAFATLMNRKAERLGCENTYFITPNGLDSQESIPMPDGSVVTKVHATTAVELAKIFSYCILQSPAKEDFLFITRKPTHSFVSLSPGNRSFTCTNHNLFLQMMTGALSGKTGFTNNAGYCYVGALESEGRTFVVALLACGWPSNKNYKWSDTKQLMNYGKENFYYRDFSTPEIAYDTARLPLIPVEGGQMKTLGETPMLSLEIYRERFEGVPGILLEKDVSVDVECHVNKQIRAPIEKGNVLGAITYSVGETIYKKEYIIASETIDKLDFRWCVMEIWKRYIS